MAKDDLVNTTRAILAKAGFDVSSSLTVRNMCFDVVARRDDTLLIIKVLSNVDSFTRENSNNLKTVADAMDANPLLIGETSSSGPLECGIVYSRFKIPIISNETLADHLLEEVPPFIFAAPGGLYVKIDGDLLREIREENNISLGTIAEVAGVSRRAIQMYESGMGAMIDAALRLEEYLGTEIINSIDPFEYVRDEKTSVTIKVDSPQLSHIADMGFSVSPVVKSPFEAVTRSSEITVFTGLGPADERMIRKALIVAEMSKVAGRHAMMIVDKKHDDNIDSTAIVSNEELKKMDDSKELTDIILSRSTKK